MDSDTIDQARDLVSGGIDWDYLLGRAHYDMMMPLLHEHLNAVCPGAVPRTVLGVLRDRVLASTYRGSLLALELLRILRRLEDHGIRAVPFKGPVLAISVYGSLALREFGDLDMFVRRTQMRATKEVLLADGYKSVQEWPSEHHLIGPGGRFSLDVHSSFTPRSFPFRLGLDSLCKPLERVSLLAGDVLSFSPEDVLLILCAHGSRHFWARLRWLCDISELVLSRESMDWGVLLDQAGRIGASRMLLVGLLASHHVLGTPVPMEVLQATETDDTARSIAEHVCNLHLADTPRFPQLHTNPVVIRMRERLRDRIPGYLGILWHAARRR